MSYVFYDKVNYGILNPLIVDLEESSAPGCWVSISSRPPYSKYSIINRSFGLTRFKIMPGDDLVLILRSKLAEIATPAPLTYD
jgi:hypothetical protein